MNILAWFSYLDSYSRTIASTSSAVCMILCDTKASKNWHGTHFGFLDLRPHFLSSSFGFEAYEVWIYFRVRASYMHAHKTAYIYGACTLQHSAGHISSSTGSIRFASIYVPSIFSVVRASERGGTAMSLKISCAWRRNGNI